jgi:FkbM family methyltransferase
LPDLGCSVLTTKAFFESPEKYADCLAVDRYCTWLPGVKYKHQFRRIGMECLRLEQFLNSPALRNFPGFYRGNSDYMLAHFDELLALESIWADARSAQVYYTVLAGFISMDFTYFALTCDDHRERYFPSDVGFLFGENEVLLDCGSHHGGEILIFAGKTRNRFKAVHGFEPALENFGILTRNMTHYMAERGIDNIRCYPLGVYDRNDYLGFAGADTILTVTDQRAVDGKGVFVARMDDVVEEATCVRLEVEGAEAPALRGAAQLIGRHRPKLVVSAYHRPDDFLTLSRQIQEFDLGYSFRLRHQSLEAGVLCLYCS